jgi:glutaconate CoA-transferase subunit A
MDTSTDKVTDLRTAVDRFVADGSHVSIGGFTVNRNPMAAVYEIIRQKKRNLHLYAHSNGQGVDELVGAGCVSRIEIAYAGNGRFAPTCYRFRRAVERGTLQVEDYSNYQMTLRFMAGAMGVPFLPTRSSLGTSLLSRWGFSEAERKRDPRLPNRKVHELDNPFAGWGGADKVVLVPAVNPDVTLIHVQKADRAGTARIEGLTFADVEQAKAAARVILTCEELVTTDALRENPDANQIPFFCVDAVVCVPHGAYPTACYRYYDYDPAYLNDYRKAAADDDRFRAYLRENVFETADHAAFVAARGADRLKAIAADPRTGYAVGLDRR